VRTLQIGQMGTPLVPTKKVVKTQHGVSPLLELLGLRQQAGLVSTTGQVAGARVAA